jgi:hypothetical protein
MDAAAQSRSPLDTRTPKNLTAIPNTEGVRALRSIPGYNRLGSDSHSYEVEQRARRDREMFGDK